MNTDQKTQGLNKITEQVIGCAFRVGNALGHGFLEKVYENALVHELRKAGLSVGQQKRIKVWYDGVVVGEYVVDLIVEGTVVVELKAQTCLTDVDSAQALNCLTATRLSICLLLNFGKKVDVRRFVGPTMLPE